MKNGVQEIEEKLAQAIKRGEAPIFQGRYNLHSSGIFYSDGIDGSCKFITLTVSLGGQRIIITRQRHYKNTSHRINNEDDGDVSTYNGRLGSIDLMEEAIKAAIIQRWPALAEYMKKVKTTNYAVHAVCHQEKHHVSVHLQVAIENGKTIKGRISREGSDTMDISFQVLMIIYNWVAWRLLRRISGEAKANDKKPRGKQIETTLNVL